MISNIHANGADWVPFTIFQSGEHTLMNHWVADQTPVKRGDIIMVDMVGFFGGYYMDAARMAMLANRLRPRRMLIRVSCGCRGRCLISSSRAFAPRRFSPKAFVRQGTST